MAKIYVLQCTLYVHMNVHLRFKKKFITDVENYSGLYLAALQAAPLPLPPPRGMDRGFCSCITCRKISDLGKVVYRRIQILMVAAILLR